MNTSCPPKKPGKPTHLWIEDDRPSGFGHRSQFKFTGGKDISIPGTQMSYEKEKKLLLSMKYWLVYRDPCIGFIKIPI